MSNQDFSISFLVDQSPIEVYNAINNVRGWWSETLEGNSHQVGDEFVYRHGNLHYSKHRVTELVPGECVVWKVTDGELTFVEHPDEWVGTTNVFEISAKDGKTELKFTHQGLSPQLECFGACSGGWTHYFTTSLLPLITTGKGTPDKAQDEPAKRFEVEE